MEPPRPPDIDAARDALLGWYRDNARPLPWRDARDPWRVWVSEVMLQQTRVETVIPYYRRFVERFPTARSLAEAAEGDVLALWSGLGYYRRARLLHAGARAVVERHSGEVPGDARGSPRSPWSRVSTRSTLPSTRGARSPNAMLPTAPAV